MFLTMGPSIKKMGQGPRLRGEWGARAILSGLTAGVELRRLSAFRPPPTLPSAWVRGARANLRLWSAEPGRPDQHASPGTGRSRVEQRTWV